MVRAAKWPESNTARGYILPFLYGSLPASSLLISALAFLIPKYRIVKIIIVKIGSNSCHKARISPINVRLRIVIVF